MKVSVLLVVLPAVAMANPLSLESIKGLFSRQTAALNAATDRLLFSTTLESFTATRAKKDPAGLDWSADSCSSSPDNPFGFNFDPACNRHDFGYRNYKRQARFTDANKLKIDDNFKADLYHQCAKEEHDSTCRGTANVYYEAVRQFGKREAELELEALLY